jgi:hypothetical protein
MGYKAYRFKVCKNLIYDVVDRFSKIDENQEMMYPAYLYDVTGKLTVNDLKVGDWLYIMTDLGLECDGQIESVEEQ